MKGRGTGHKIARLHQARFIIKSHGTRFHTVLHPMTEGTKRCTWGCQPYSWGNFVFTIVICRRKYSAELFSILWNNQQMQLYAVNFIPLLGSLYMFRVFYTPTIRSTIYNCIYSHWYLLPAWPAATLGVSSWDDTMVCTSGCRYS